MIRTRAPMDPTGELLGDRHWPIQELYYYPPDKFISIHRERLTYIAAGEPATLWVASQKVATGRALVFGTTVGIYAERVYDCFTDEQLHTLWLNTMKTEFTGENIREACVDLGRKIKPFPTPVHLLNYDPENPPVYTPNVPISHPEKGSTRVRNTQGSTQGNTQWEKPLQGTKTGLVWDKADEVLAKYPNMTKKQLKQEVINVCVKCGINPSTAQVQFGKWASQKALTN